MKLESITAAKYLLQFYIVKNDFSFFKCNGIACESRQRSPKKIDDINEIFGHVCMIDVIRFRTEENMFSIQSF